jgi:hypothetical protein
MKLYYRLWRTRIPNLRSDFPFELPIGLKAGQSEASFSVLRLFEVLIELYYRLSVARSPNPISDSEVGFSIGDSYWLENGPIRNELFNFKAFAYFR